MHPRELTAVDGLSSRFIPDRPWPNTECLTLNLQVLPWLGSCWSTLMSWRGDSCLPFFLPSQISNFLGVPILWCTNRLFQTRNALKKLGKRPNAQHAAMRTFSLCLQELALRLQAPGRQKTWCHKGVAGAAPSCVGTSPGASDPGTGWQGWPKPQTQLKTGQPSTSECQDNGMALGWYIWHRPVWQNLPILCPEDDEEPFKELLNTRTTHAAFFFSKGCTLRGTKRKKGSKEWNEMMWLAHFVGDRVLMETQRGCVYQYRQANCRPGSFATRI